MIRKVSPGMKKIRYIPVVLEQVAGQAQVAGGKDHRMQHRH